MTKQLVEGRAGTWLLAGLLSAATILELVTGPSACGKDFGTRRAVQWFPYEEWTVENPEWKGNAFDVVATVEFTHQGSDERRKTEMFFQGGRSWGFRFTGTKPGTWTFRTVSEDGELNGHTGQVEVRANPSAAAHGFLKQFGDKWGWEGTETAFVPQLVMWDYVTGSNKPQVFRNKPDLIREKIKEFFVGHGFNGFHLPVLAGRWFDFDAENERVRDSMTEPDLRTFEALELLIAETHAAGGMVHIWSWGDHQRYQTPRSLKGGIGGEVNRRLQRYIAARLGPLPGWSMGYGFDLDEWVKARQVKAWRDSMHGFLGWSHFFGGRPAGPNRGLDHGADAKWNRGLDYSSYEHHQPTYEVYRAALKAVPGVPVMSEDRFRIRKSQYRDKDYSPERTRRGLYDSTMAGGVANIWGISPDLAPGGVFPNKDQIKAYAVFFHEKGRFVPDMKPANRLSADSKTRVLRSPKAGSIILYRESTDRMEVDLSSMKGAMKAVAVDAMKPYVEVDLGEIKATKQTIELPHKSDWVVGGERL